VRVVAIICARNEEIHIRGALTDLINEGLDVLLIDHDSVDRTVAIAREFIGRGLLGIERLPWTGRFSLLEQLEAKRRLAAAVDHDWVVHVDADEWLSAPDSGQTLRDGLIAAHTGGYNCVNFNEFVFLPRPGEDLLREDYRRCVTRYYFFRPSYPRLMRAWKNRVGLENSMHGGHLLSGPVRLFPRDFPLRHYISLSEPHAEQKYLNRPFDDAEIANGWHRNRMSATKETLRFPDDERMRILPHWSSKQYDVSEPSSEHFWDWTHKEAPNS